MDNNRLHWASRRGMLELDLVLMPFLEDAYPHLPLEDQKRYWQLLECEDPELFAWFLGHQQPEDADLSRIVGIILAHHRQLADAAGGE